MGLRHGPYTYGWRNQESSAMDESLTERRRVEDEGLRVVNSFRPDIRRGKEAPANYVPEASVIRRVQALSGITGRKAFRRRTDKSIVKYPGSTGGPLSKLLV